MKVKIMEIWTHNTETHTDSDTYMGTDILFHYVHFICNLVGLCKLNVANQDIEREKVS